MRKTITILILALAGFGFQIQSIEDGRSWEGARLDSGDVKTTEHLPFGDWFTITDYSTGSAGFVIDYDTLHPTDGDWDTITVDYALVGKIQITCALDNPSPLVYGDGIFVYANDTTGISPQCVPYNHTLTFDHLHGEIARIIIWAASDDYEVVITQIRRSYADYIELSNVQSENIVGKP